MHSSQAARQLAELRHLPVTGALGILKTAAASGWIDLAATFRGLGQTKFRASAVLLQTLLDEEAACQDKSIRHLFLAAD